MNSNDPLSGVSQRFRAKKFFQEMTARRQRFSRTTETLSKGRSYTKHKNTARTCQKKPISKRDLSSEYVEQVVGGHQVKEMTDFTL